MKRFSLLMISLVLLSFIVQALTAEGWQKGPRRRDSSVSEVVDN